MLKRDIDSILEIGEKEKYFRTSSTLHSFWSQLQLEKWIKSECDVLLVAEEGNRILGFAIASLHELTGKATFENLWVAPSARGKKLGNRLTMALTENLKA